MARRKRRDEAGVSYHVMNRGVARRTIFDTRPDYRFFLACLARAVRRAEIDVLAHEEIAEILHADVSRVKRLCRFHGRCVELLASYARLAAGVVAHCQALLDSDRAALPGTNRPQL